jgi:hypothetical protein
VRRYRSTSMRLASEHCPRALDHLEVGTPYDRRQYAAGVAAHAVLQAVGEATNRAGGQLSPAELERVAGETAARLIATGRSFDGEAEPPLPADDTWLGRDLALDWIASHPIEPGAAYETGLGASPTWQPVPYDSPLARYRGILDVRLVADDGDEESAWRTVVVRDFKSSWAAGEGELDQLQFRGYAVLAWLHEPDVAVIRLELANLRTRKVFTREIQVDEDGRSLLRRWRDDLQATMDALDGMSDSGGRPAVPGRGCAGCPYLGRCEAAREFFVAGDVPATAEARARTYAVLDARREQLGELLRADSDEAPVDIGDALVGTVGREQRCAAPEATAVLWDTWQRWGGDAPGLLRALAPSFGSLEHAVRVLYPERGDKLLREDLLDQLVDTEVKRRFGVWPKPRETAA